MRFELKPLDRLYHDGEGGFREQMAVLYPAGQYEDQVKFIRTFISIGQPSVVGFDPDNPGADTAAGWQRLDGLIEDGRVRGLFHTHPEGVLDFSEQDKRAQTALAQAKGKLPIYHGVQALGNSTAHWIAMHMISGKVICYDFGWQESDLADPVILLPLPPVAVWDKQVITIVY